MTKTLDPQSINSDLKPGTFIITYQGGGKNAKEIFKIIRDRLVNDPDVYVTEQNNDVTGHWQYLAIDRRGVNIFDYYRRTNPETRKHGYISINNRRVNKGDSVIIDAKFENFLHVPKDTFAALFDIEVA